MKIYHDNLHLLLPAWLRKIGETYHNEAAKIYHSMNVPFETSWFPVFFVLHRHHQVTISQIAEILDISQPAVSQVTSALQKRGLITLRINSKDNRKKDIALSDAGAQLMYRLEPIWTSIDRAMAQILHSNPKTRQLGTSLSSLDANMRELLHDNTISLLMDRPITIKYVLPDDDIDLYTTFKKMEDVEFIYPEASSKVLAAVAEREILGAVAVEKQNDEEYILHNLFVCSNHRLKGIAKALLERAVPQEHKVCIIMDRATPQLVDLLLKCPYSFKVELTTD